MPDECLTIDAARPGLRVRLVKSYGGFPPGYYTVEQRWGDRIFLQGIGGWLFDPSMFVFDADEQPTHVSSPLPTPQSPDRLTMAVARPGMRVRCVLNGCDIGGEVRAGREYTLAEARNKLGAEAVRLRETGDFWWHMRRFVPASEPTLAAVLAERAPEFLAAVRRIYERDKDVPRSFLSPAFRAFLDAIERTGILAQEPRFHLTPKQFQEMHNAG